MNILITGGAGFIGTNLIRFLIEETDHTVLNLDALTYAGNLNSLSDLSGHPRYRFKQTDICNPKQVARAFETFAPDWVMHLAAESHVDRSIDGPDTFIQTNIVGTYHLLQVSLQYWKSLPAGECEGEKVKKCEGEEKKPSTFSPSDLPTFPPSNLPTQQTFRFLHVSTDEVYGSLGPKGQFSESTAYDPHSPYSASKAASDHLARAWADTYGLPVLVTHCSNNYGPYQFPEKLIPTVILKALRNEAIPVYGQGEHVRDWLYVQDHVEALYAVVSNGRPGETYNIGGNNELRNIDLVRKLCHLIDELKPRADGESYAQQIAFVSDRPGHDLRYAIDASKIKNELGWAPKQDHSSSFRKTIQWYLNNPAWTRQTLNESDQLGRLGESKERD